MVLSERQRIVMDLMRDSQSIIDSMVKSLSNSRYLDVDEVNDWADLKFLRDRLMSLFLLMEAEQEFGSLFGEIKEMANSDKEEVKWSLPIIGSLRNFVKNVLLKVVEDIIASSRSKNFEDYRARDFQSDLSRDMKMLREDYREIYKL